MRVEVDSGGVLLASTHLADRSSLVLGQVAHCGRLPAGLHDPSLVAAVGALADVAADVLDPVARDLELLATKVRSGAVLYDRVEQRLRDGMTWP